MPQKIPPIQPLKSSPDIRQESEEWVLRGFKNKSNAEKLRCFRKAVDLDPTNIRAWDQIAWNIDDNKEKERCYRKVIELDPSSSQAWLNLGHTLIKVTDRIHCYHMAINRDITNLGAWVNLAFLQEDILVKEVILRKIYELSPNNYGALKGLCELAIDPFEKNYFYEKLQQLRAFMVKNGVLIIDE